MLMFAIVISRRQKSPLTGKEMRDDVSITCYSIPKTNQGQWPILDFRFRYDSYKIPSLIG